MERYHELRVAVLTLFLSFIAIAFFLTYGLTYGNPRRFQCELNDEFYVSSCVY